jgi:hypothetical protein
MFKLLFNLVKKNKEFDSLIREFRLDVCQYRLED